MLIFLRSQDFSFEKTALQKVQKSHKKSHNVYET